MKQYEPMNNQKDQNQPIAKPIERVKQASLPLFSKYLPVILIALIAGVIGSGSTYLALNSKTKPQPIVSNPSPTPAPDPTANWQTYTDAKWGFTFKYPLSTFILTDSSTEPPNKVLSRHIDIRSLKDKLNEFTLQVMQQPINADGKIYFNLEDLVNDQFKGLQPIIAPASFGGKEALVARYLSAQGGQTYNKVIMAFSRDNQFIYNAYIDDSPEAIGIKILSTFKFTP